MGTFGNTGLKIMGHLCSLMKDTVKQQMTPKSLFLSSS